MREGGCHGGSICFDNHSFPKIPGNHVPGLTTRKSPRSKDWDKVLFLPHSLVPQSTFSVSAGQCQKVTLSTKTLNFPPEGGCCLLLGPHGLWEGFGIWVSNWFLQDQFTQVYLILLALGTVLCYCPHSSIPQYKYYEAVSLWNKMPTNTAGWLPHAWQTSNS